jgi:hypothetical protein
MYLKNCKLCFVQIPNSYEKACVEALEPFACEEDDCIKEALHPERICEKIGFLASRNTKLFAVVENTYERLVHLYKAFYEHEEDKRFHTFGEFIRYIYEAKVSDTIDQRWYIHNILNGDVDNSTFRNFDVDEVAVENIFVRGDAKLNKFLSEALDVEISLDLSPTAKARDFYTTEIKDMVDVMYEKEMEHFNFKYPK